ncbi:MAG: hypothetical protein AAF944_23250 [Bacteroidota bacterium]
MPITYDPTTDGLYQQGFEQKTLQAIAKAIQQGILTLEQIAEMLEVPLDTVIQVRDSLEKG